MIDKTKTKPLTRQQELMGVLRFSMRDLTANRGGLLTDKQSKRLLESNFNSVALSGCGSIILLGLAIAAMVSIAYKQIFFAVFALVISIPILILALIFGQSAWRLRHDVKANQVFAVQGLAIVQNNGQSYSLSVNGIELLTSLEAVLRIKHLEPHIIYYLPRSKVVVSVEVIEA